MMKRQLQQRKEPEVLGEARENTLEWSAANWAIFLLERAPPLVFLLLAAGPCLSGLYMTQGYIDIEKFIWALMGELDLQCYDEGEPSSKPSNREDTSFKYPTRLLTFVCYTQVLLLLIRVMDDVKDYDKDVIVHPERPLPRGLIQYREVVAAIYITLVAMTLYAVVLGLRFNWTVAILFGIQIFYTYLMYVEFGCGETLEKSPFIYGLIHQLSIYFGAYFICVLGGESWTSPLPLLIGSVAFSGFFTYEICRKLDPTLPLLKGTYLVVYGKWSTFGFTVGTVLVGVVSSFYLGLNFLLWPLEGVLIASLLVLLTFSREPGKLQEGENKPKAHKLLEGLAVLYLLVHMWSGYLNRFF